MQRTFTTIRELIYWEYAKLISGSAIGDRGNFKFVNFTYRKLIEGRAAPATILAENQKLFALGNVCAYCGASGPLHWEHIIPASRGGPDTIDNMVRACAPCNLAKGPRDPYQWYLGAKSTEQIPRLVLGKFLKLTYEAYETHGLLDSKEYIMNHKIERVTLSSIFNHGKDFAPENAA
jgi:hypothetical protein